MPKTGVNTDRINRNKSSADSGTRVFNSKDESRMVIVLLFLGSGRLEASLQRVVGETLVSFWINSRRMTGIFSNSAVLSRKKFAPACKHSSRYCGYG